MKTIIEMALEYLKLQKMYGPAMGFGNTTIDEAITAIKEALAQPEQEPVARYNDAYGPFREDILAWRDRAALGWVESRGSR